MSLIYEYHSLLIIHSTSTYCGYKSYSIYLNMNLPLNHSIENIYVQVGQYDRYAIFDFFFNSEAYRLYGKAYTVTFFTPQMKEPY